MDEFSEDCAGVAMALLVDYLSGREYSTSIRTAIYRYLRGRSVQSEDLALKISRREGVKATAGLAHRMAFPLRLYSPSTARVFV